MDPKIKEGIINLYEDNQYGNAINACQSYYKYHEDSFSIEDKEELAKIIFEYNIDLQDVPLEYFYEAVIFVQSLLEQKDCSKVDSICYYTKSIMVAMKYYNDKSNYDHVLIFSKMINPDFLTENNESFTYSNGGEGLYRSNKENWFSFTSKALVNKKLYKENIKLTEKALNDLNNFTANNKYWFKYRYAVSLNRLEKYDDALKILNSLLRKKRDWNVQNEISFAHYYKKDYDNSLINAIDAVLNKEGDIKSKLKVYKRIKEILEINGMHNEIVLHQLLIEAIICDIKSSSNKKNCSKDYEVLEEKLKPLWKEMMHKLKNNDF